MSQSRCYGLLLALPRLVRTFSPMNRRSLRPSDYLLCLLLILLFRPGHVEAQSGYFEFSPTARETYRLIFSLRFEEARQGLVRMQVEERDNLIIHSLENYLDCLTIFIGEQQHTFEKLKANKEMRLDAIRQGTQDSPYYLYAQADIHIQWAIARVKFEEYFLAVLEIKRAYNLLQKNERLFPDFAPTRTKLGILHALIGTVPDQYKWGVKLLGMNGTIAQGKAEIEEVLAHARRHDFVFRDETYVIYAYLLLRLENNAAEAWSVLQTSGIDPRENPLATFVWANIAMESGRNDLAIEYLKARPRGKEYFAFPYLHLMEGIARMNRLEVEADNHIQLFLKETRGVHYIKEAYQKLAWCAVMRGDETQYERYMEACKRLGHDVVEEDKAALHEARAAKRPHRDLLTVRVLSDGGYYRDALSYLEQHVNTTFANKSHQLEFTYRKARLNDQLHQSEAALRGYRTTIELGRDDSEYYACNAAILSALIYERQSRKDLSREHYQMALSIKPDEYRSSLHQKAKAGLNRLAMLP